MAVYNGPVCRLCRRDGVKLFFKGERCYTSKCAIERRKYPPGQHGQRRPDWRCRWQPERLTTFTRGQVVLWEASFASL